MVIESAKDLSLQGEMTVISDKETNQYKSYLLASNSIINHYL